MILTNRLFTRREPVKEAKSVYIFCEGKKREYQYFRYFQGIDSRINIVIHEIGLTRKQLAYRTLPIISATFDQK